jgi:hypothetical protein
MPRLPVSGLEIVLREPDGSDDLALHEATGGPAAQGLALLTRLAERGAGEIADLPATDFEVLLLHHGASRVGPRMTLAFACPRCRAMAEISFMSADFVASVAPRPAPGVTADPDRPGWRRLDGAGFRLPTAGDLAAIEAHAHPGRALAERCLDATARRRDVRARVERAMEKLAPPLSRPIAGRCPECGGAVRAGLSVRSAVMTELKRTVASIHEDIDLIARAYHWPEPAILALPRRRRQAYADRIRRGQAKAA